MGLSYIKLYATINSYLDFSSSLEHAEAPGGALSIKADRVVQTTISRLASGHIRGLSFNLGQEIYENCTKCNLVQATPDHLLFCAGLDREDIYSSPLLVYDFLRTLGLMDLV
ncbi:RNase H domain-containing protein [Trichonephila clavipes]|nr:RNase H domain-containing protein [Trichonephila clavipes]